MGSDLTRAAVSAAPLVSLDAARARFAERAAERAERNATLAHREDLERQAFADRERARWLADLDTWPEPFRRRLRDDVVQRTFESDVCTAVRWLRSAAAELRAARGAPRRVKCHRAKQLESAKADLLEVLWTWGRRRIDPAEVVRWARARDVARAAQHVAGVEARLAEGRYQKDKRRGRHFTRGARGRFESELSRTQAAGAEAREDLAELEARDDPDPLLAVEFRSAR
jgi:hypothetical protein